MITFEKWKATRDKEDERILKNLSRRLSDEIGELIHSITEAEVLTARYQCLLAEAERYLDGAKANALVIMRGNDLIGDERDIFIKDATKEERFERARISGLIKALEVRISLGQTLIKTFRDKGGVA